MIALGTAVAEDEPLNDLARLRAFLPLPVLRGRVGVGAMVRCFGLMIQGSSPKTPTLPSPGVPGEGITTTSAYSRKVI